MHLHLYHPVLYQFTVSSLSTQIYKDFEEPYLICSVTTPGHVTDFRDGFVFSMWRYTALCSLSFAICLTGDPVTPDHH